MTLEDAPGIARLGQLSEWPILYRLVAIPHGEPTPPLGSDSPIRFPVVIGWLGNASADI